MMDYVNDGTFRAIHVYTQAAPIVYTSTEWNVNGHRRFIPIGFDASDWMLVAVTRSGFYNLGFSGQSLV